MLTGPRKKKKKGYHHFLTCFHTIGKRDQHWISKGSLKGNYGRSRISSPNGEHMEERACREEVEASFTVEW